MLTEKMVENLQSTPPRQILERGSTITKRIDGVTHIPERFLNASGIAPPPIAAKIELTSRCNFRCGFCATGQGLRPHKDMDKSLFKKIATELRECGVNDIGMFFLGESFLVPWLGEAIEFLKKDLDTEYVFLTSNGSMSSPKKMEEVFRAGLDSLKFSFNYATEEQFVEVAKVSPKFFHSLISNAKASRGIRDRVWEETGHKTGLYASYILFDGKQGELMKDLVEEMSEYLDEIYRLPLYSHGSQIVEEDERDLGWKPDGGNRGRADSMVSLLPCWVAHTEAHICYDGALAACCFDHTNESDMGNLSAMHFWEAWNSEKFRTLRQAHFRKDVHGTMCEECVYGEAHDKADKFGLQKQEYGKKKTTCASKAAEIVNNM